MSFLLDYRDRISSMNVTHIISRIEDDGVRLIREPSFGIWDWKMPIWKTKNSDFLEVTIRARIGLPDTNTYERQVSQVGGECSEYFIGTALSGREMSDGSVWYWDGPRPMISGTDMVKIHPDDRLEYLQIKKSDKSENSSSAVSMKHPQGLLKFNVFCNKTAKTNWHNFPCVESRQYLSDEGLLAATNEYLDMMPNPVPEKYRAALQR